MHPLDNVIWKALTTSQVKFAEASDLARRFQEEVSVLGAVREQSEEAYGSLANLTKSRTVGVLLEGAEAPHGWTVIAGGNLMQMLHENGSLMASAASDTPPFSDLGPADAPEMVALAELTRPGPFGPRTRELGRYIGIRQNGSLAAMAGERLRIPGYTEVSAVCTHPEFLGRGYARSLMMELMQRIIERAERPFLHVRSDNTRAIELYRRLGFTERAHLYYAVMRYSGKL